MLGLAHAHRHPRPDAGPAAVVPPAVAAPAAARPGMLFAWGWRGRDRRDRDGGRDRTGAPAAGGCLHGDGSLFRSCPAAGTVADPSPQQLHGPAPRGARPFVEARVVLVVLGGRSNVGPSPRLSWPGQHSRGRGGLPSGKYAAAADAGDPEIWPAASGTLGAVPFRAPLRGGRRPPSRSPRAPAGRGRTVYDGLGPEAPRGWSPDGRARVPGSTGMRHAGECPASLDTGSRPDSTFGDLASPLPAVGSGGPPAKAPGVRSLE